MQRFSGEFLVLEGVGEVLAAMVHTLVVAGSCSTNSESTGIVTEYCRGIGDVF